MSCEECHSLALHIAHLAAWNWAKLSCGLQFRCTFNTDWGELSRVIRTQLCELWLVWTWMPLIQPKSTRLLEDFFRTLLDIVAPVKTLVHNSTDVFRARSNIPYNFRQPKCMFFYLNSTRNFPRTSVKGLTTQLHFYCYCTAHWNS